MAPENLKRGWTSNGDELAVPRKLPRSQALCPMCHVSVANTTRNTIQCIQCELWVHVSKCTDLKATDLIDKRVTGRFTCKHCLERLEMEIDAETITQQASSSQENVLGRILTELMSLRKETFELRKLIPEIALLRDENAEMRRMIQKLSSSPEASRSASRGRSASKQPSATRMLKGPLEAGAKTPRSADMRFEMDSRKGSVTTKTTARLDFAKAVRGRSEPAKPRQPQRMLRVERKQSEAAGCFRLPKSNVRLFSRRVLVVLRDTDIEAQGLYEYLGKMTAGVISVTSLRRRFDHYRSFVIECNEMIVEKLFDESLWDPDTLVKEYNGVPRNDMVLSCFPQRG